MATETELAALADALRSATGATNASASAAGQAANAMTEAQKGAKQFSNAVDAVPGAVGGFIRSVAQGNTEFKQFNTMLDLATSAAGGLARTIPVLGGFFAAGIQAAGEAAKFLVTQLDDVNSTFREFGKTGALGAQGMQGLVDQFAQSGLTLQSYRKIILSNSDALAAMSGMVSTGADTFSKAVGILANDSTDVGMELRRLGLNAEGMGEAAAAFMSREARLGRAQGMSAQQLAAGTAKYAKELDEIAKITGATKDSMKAQQDAALSEARFRAQTQLMIDKGLDPTNLINFQTAISQMAPALGQGIRDLSTGNATTDAAKQLIASSGGAASKILDNLKNGLIGPAEAGQQLQEAIKANRTAMLNHSVAVGNDSGVFPDLAQTVNFLERDLSNWGKVVTETQKKQTEGGDKLTESTIQASRNMELFSQGLNQLAVEALPYTAKVLVTSMEVIKKVVQGIMPEGYLPPAWSNVQAQPGAPAAPGASNAPAFIQQNAAALAQSMAGRPQLNLGSNPAGGTAATPGAPDPLAGLSNVTSRGERGSAGYIDPKLIELAHKVAAAYPGSRFSSINDYYHTSGKHTEGKALDFVLPPEFGPVTVEKGEAIRQALINMGFGAGTKDEYNSRSRGWTGSHIHAELATGGVISGPRSGYSATLHGTEAVVPLPDGRSIPVQNVDSGASAEQLDRLDTIISVMRDQVTATKKLLQYAS